MKRTPFILAICAAALCALSIPAAAGPVDLGIGVYGGINYPVLEDGASGGAAYGAKLRVLTPLPMLAGEVYYTRMGQTDIEDIWEDDISVALEGDGFNVYGADVLFGNLRGAPGLKLFSVAGVNFVNFEGDGSDELKMGGEIGAGIEFAPPIVGLSVEVRGMLMVLAWSEGADKKLATVTAGVNYYF